MAIVHNLEYVVTLLLVLSILVVAHEWGHFIVARIFGVRVDDFSIGFGKRLVRLGKRGDTEYNLRMLPFGGFVKIAGMAADEEPLVRAKDKVLAGKDADPDAHDLPLVAENIERSPSLQGIPPAPDEFGSKALWQRSLIILAGPFMSFVLGYVVFCLLGFAIGWPTGKPLPKVAQVEPGGEGHRIGLRAGDVIRSINGLPITQGGQMIDLIHNSLGKPMTLVVQRSGQTLTLHPTPRALVDADGQKMLDVEVVTPGAAGNVLGLQAGDDIHGVNDTPINSAADVTKQLTQARGKAVKVYVLRKGVDDVVTLSGRLPALLSANALPVINAHPVGGLKFLPAQEIEKVGIAESVRKGNLVIVRLFAMLGSMLKHGQLHQSAGGIIRMYQFTALAVENGPFEVVSLAAQLSISLAIFNLLPIPILDGGHLLSFFIEWVRRGKKMTEQQQQAFLMTGLAIIAVLFVLIMTNDILRTLQHQTPQ